ncbi:MAG: ATP-dependent helicase [Pyrodictiaceae archaeon]
MITAVKRCFKDSEVFSMLRPYVASWIKSKYGALTEPQRCAIPLIKQGENVLISSPTGTGKTLAAFLGILDELFRLSENNSLENKIYVIYVSPLRALNNDMKKNLLTPLKEIKEVASSMGYEVGEVKVKVRTSDTPPHEKQAMVKNPPHILITTPESLATALVAPKFRERLATARWIIVDEIHELASSKRGAHLSITLERLEELIVRRSGWRLQRIGLSATISPLEEVAKFLVGFNDDGSPRSCKIVDARFSKPIDIRVLVPLKNILEATADEINEAIYRLIARLVKEHRTTLIFTNTRSATERVVYKLKRILKDLNIADMDSIEAHHSSLGRELRLEVEDKLKKGKLKVVVSSTSLELGIDIGYIDLVILLSSPKSVSRLLQRIGRAGHHIRQVSKGRIIVVDRDDLVECTVLAKAALERKIDNIHIPRNALDVLAQHIVAMSLEKKWRLEEAYRVIKRSYNYHDLSWEDYIATVRFLAGKDPDLESQRVYAKIWLDEDEGLFGKKRGARAIYLMNNGTIPDEVKIHVFTIDKRRYVGDLEEDFVQLLAPGDIFVLGGRTYEFIRSDGIIAYVKPAEGAKPTVPTWYSEMLPLAYDSALLVGAFRRKIAEMIKNGVPEEKIIEYLVREYNLEEHAAKDIYRYILEQMVFTKGLVPSDKLILIEHYLDYQEGSTNIIFHTLFGRRTNDALSRAYAYILSKLTNKNVRVVVTDNGFMLTIPGILNKIDLDRLVKEVNSRNIREILSRALRNTELLKRRFRHCAERSLMLLRRYRGRERDPHRLQINAEALLEAVKSMNSFPVLKETYREILEDYMDIEHAVEVLKNIEEGKISIKVFGPTSIPSPFAHSIVARGYSDIVLMEDRRRLILDLHKQVLEAIGMRTPNLEGGELEA